MSDTTVAPEGSAPAAAPVTDTASAGRETPINPSPTSTPNPIGSQAPPAPTGEIEGSRHRPESRSEATRAAVQRAFERSANPRVQPQRPAPQPPKGPAEAKAGHNQPPGDTAGADRETPKLDLKKRPSEQPAQERGEHGHFAPRQGAASPGQAGQQQPKPNLSSPYHQPPARMSEIARRDWHATPETVKGDIHRIQSEFAKAYNFYRADYEAFKPIKHYHQMAQQQGTTLEKALNNYYSIEQKLYEDPIGALDVIVRNLDRKHPDGSPITLRDLAYTILSQTPEQIKQTQQGNVQAAAQRQIGELHKEIAGLKNHLQQIHNQAKYTYTRSAVDNFAATHPRLDELGTAIQQEIHFGFDLETAYRRADALYPSTHPEQIRTRAEQIRTTPAQTRPADKSIHGSPGGSALNGASRRPKEASRNPREALDNAYRRVAVSY